MAENFGVQARYAFYDQRWATRDVVQNHIFQMMCNLAMEPAALEFSESSRDEKAKVLEAIAQLEQKNRGRGHFRGHLDGKGVTPDSRTETFAALCLEVKSWRWKDVPFYIRAGKNLPQTCTGGDRTVPQAPATQIVNKQASQT